MDSEEYFTSGTNTSTTTVELTHATVCSYFGIVPDKNLQICKKCHSTVATKGSNTTNQTLS